MKDEDDDDPSPDAERSPEHVMLSYNWFDQRSVVRLNRSLQQRGYSTWIDLERMKGSTLDSISDAVVC